MNNHNLPPLKPILERAGAYLAKMPAAASGQGQHSAIFEVAVALVKGFGLSPEEALPLLLQWNQHCVPPWSESELRHKLRSAATTDTRPDGYLLVDAPLLATYTLRNTNPVLPLAALLPTMPEFKSEADLRALKRLSWPAFYLPENNDLDEIAAQRRIPMTALRVLVDRGLLKSARCGGHSCFVLHEERFAQARRYDGRPFQDAEGRTFKTRNLPGSEGAFFGRSLLQNIPNVLLVEGVIGLVEAAATFCFLGKMNHWTVLAATSASSCFARDPALLKKLAGRHVRILPDADEAGLNGAASWLADLRAVGARVDVMGLPAGHKDLGSLIAEPETHRETLTSLFQ